MSIGKLPLAKQEVQKFKVDPQVRQLVEHCMHVPCKRVNEGWQAVQEDDEKGCVHDKQDVSHERQA